MIAVVSHDAGGAEILSSWLRHNNQPHCLVLDGPAKKIFQNKLDDCEICSLDYAIELCDWVLCGTSWKSNLERNAIVQAKIAAKKVVTFLDHWVNYLERFQLNSVTVLPNEIWVGDTYAERIAQKLFPEIKIVLQPNPYFKDLKKDIEVFRKRPLNTQKCSVLYVCEPIREHALLEYRNEHYWGYTEEDALRFFLKNIGVLEYDVSEIKIRPHPSESQAKYEWAIYENSLVTEVASSKTLLEQILEADLVVGCDSMAMVVGLLANKRVISSIPKDGKACSLPQAEIEHLQNLVSKYQGNSNAG